MTKYSSRCYFHNIHVALIVELLIALMMRMMNIYGLVDLGSDGPDEINGGAENHAEGK